MTIDPEFFKRFEQEMRQLQMEDLPPLTVELCPLSVFALISQIQLASRHPENKNCYADAAQRLARELQGCFNPESAVYQMIELGWNPAMDFEVEVEEQVKHHFQSIGQLIVEELNKQDPDSKWEVWGDGSDAPI